MNKLAGFFFANLFTFTKEILNGELHFLRNDTSLHYLIPRNPYLVGVLYKSCLFILIPPSIETIFRISAISFYLFSTYFLQLKTTE